MLAENDAISSEKAVVPLPSRHVDALLSVEVPDEMESLDEKGYELRRVSICCQADDHDGCLPRVFGCHCACHAVAA